MSDLQQRVHHFYHAWNALEASLGADAGSVLDFDLCPRDSGVAPPPVFEHRLQALEAAKALRMELGDGGSKGLLNPSLLVCKLDAAMAYLRALMGQRMPLGQLYQTAMGASLTRVGPQELAVYTEQAANALDAHGLAFNSEGLSRYREALTRYDMGTFEADLRSEASRWLRLLAERVGLDTEALERGAGFALEVAQVDAYWSNWIDGSVESGIRLRANLHPRIRYTKTSHITLAAHEIAGHAAHVLTLMESHRRGQLDAYALNLTVHGCDAFHMEGLAQAVVPLLAYPDELPCGTAVSEALSTLHQSIMDNAHLDLEDGAPMEDLVAVACAQSPFLSPAAVTLGLRDRGRHPLFRVYQAVYGPSRRLMLKARALPDRLRFSFLYAMYQVILTPPQIEQLLLSLQKTERA